MAASSSSPPTTTRPRHYLRYSLRALLIFFTLACVGVWYWYRVPFKKEFKIPKHGVLHCWVASRPIYVDKEVQRFRRVLFGQPIRHGLTELFDEDGRKLGEEEWQEGQRHGRWKHWDTTGKVIRQGAYSIGKKDGRWIEQLGDTGNPEIRSGYDRDRLDGEWQFVDRGKVVRTIHYKQGEVLSIDGVAVDDPLGRALGAGQIDNVRLTQMLTRPGEASFHQTPLQAVAEYVSENYHVNVALARRALNEADISTDLPINLEKKYVTSGALLILLLEPHDLAATHRFDMIWITTKDDAKNWVDRTGMTDLLKSAPPEVLPSDRGKVAAGLQQPAEFDFIDAPLRDVADFVSEIYQLPIGCQPGIKDIPVTSNLRGISLQHALGALCDQYGLCVRWRDGNSLVIESQEGDGIQPRRAGKKWPGP